MNTIFILSAVFPAIVGAIAFFILGGQRDPLRSRVQAFLWALCFAGGSFMLLGRLDLFDVLVSFMYVGFALAVFVWISPKPMGSRYLIRALFVVGAGALILWPIRSGLVGPVHMRNLAAFFFLGLGLWSIMERTAQQVKIPSLIALPLISALTLAWFLHSKSDAHGLEQVLGIACALYVATLLVALVSPNRISAAAVLPFVSVFFVGFLLTAHFYFQVNPWTLIYMCIPFLVLWLRGWLPFVPHSPLPEAVILAAISVMPLLYIFWKTPLAVLT